VTGPSLPEKVLAIHARLVEANVGHAFGGALALAYYAEPRSTIDIDVNVFVSPERHAVVETALAQLGIAGDTSAEAVERDGQVRTWWNSTPVDLFYAYHELHDAMRKATRRVAFASATIPILGPEHLAACKAIFNRPKDWLDIEQILVATPDVDRDEIRRWIGAIVGGDDPRVERFVRLAEPL